MTDMLDQTANAQVMTTDELWAVTTQVELTSTSVEPADELWAPAGPSGRPPSSSTVLPPRPGPGAPPPVRRPLGKISRDEVLVLCGALFSSLSITLLFFGRLLPLDGRLGFVVVWFAVFLVIYGLLVSITDNRPAVVDRVMAALMTSSALIAGAALTSVVVFTLWSGRKALFKSNLYTEDMSAAGPLDPLTVGGISHAIAGTLIIIGISLIITVPLALACAVYLDRDPRQEDRARALGRHGDDGAAVDHRRSLHLRDLGTDPRPGTFGSRRGDRRQHHDVADHHPLGRRRAAARPRQPARGRRGTRGTTVANGVACRAPHGPSGPRHLGHPRCGPRHRGDGAGVCSCLASPGR